MKRQISIKKHSINDEFAQVKEDFLEESIPNQHSIQRSQRRSKDRLKVNDGFNDKPKVYVNERKT